MATPSRPVLRGTTYLLTRRTLERRFLLAPSKGVDEVYRYCLAVAADKYDIAVHAACCLSNHQHVVLTDPRGTVPLFAQWLHSFMARALNSYYGRWESFWSPGSYSAVELASAEEEPPSRAEVLEKMVYVLANPVSAGLVDRGSRWPGVRSGTLRHGVERWTCEKPGFFFSKSKKLPDVATLDIVPPPAFADMDPEDFGELFHEAVVEREKSIRSGFAEEGRTFLGAKKVTPPKYPKRSARSFCEKKPKTPAPRRKLNPRVASRDKWKRIERIRMRQGFLAAYRDALAEWREGNRDVVFPAGTYWMRVHHGANGEGVPPHT